MVRLSEYTKTHEFIKSHPLKVVESYRNMAQTVFRVLLNYDGVKIPEYESVCNDLAGDDYLLAIIKFLARRNKVYNTIYSEIMSLKVVILYSRLHTFIYVYY